MYYKYAFSGILFGVCSIFIIDIYITNFIDICGLKSQRNMSSSSIGSAPSAFVDYSNVSDSSQCKHHFLSSISEKMAEIKINIINSNYCTN